MGPVAIVGAGVSGLAAARVLTAAGHAVALFDKGRRIGGRASTREPRAGGSFDHGAQYFTARDPEFARVVSDWADAGVVARWEGRIASVDRPGEVCEKSKNPERWVGVPNNRAVPDQLARTLPAELASIEVGVRVDRLVRHDDGWHLSLVDMGEEGMGRSAGPFSWVVVTAPPIQATALVRGTSLESIASAHAMWPCWTTMLSFSERVPVAYDGIFVNVGPIAWCARNSSKPGRPAGEAWVLSANPDFSTEHLEDGAENVARTCADAFFEALGVAPLSATTLQAHRWRYATPKAPGAQQLAIDPGIGLALAGDWLWGAKVQGAFLSGERTGRALLKTAGQLA